MTASTGNLRSSSLQDLVVELFNKTEAPVELDALVNTVADLLELKEPRAQEESRAEQQEGERFETFTDGSPNQHINLERRLYLERLWSEICDLPPGQRTALLLNLRDSEGCCLINLFPVTGVATMRMLADALEMSAEELAELWNDLPLNDAAIALRLSITRQQVINLRKCARERLARRLNAQPESKLSRAQHRVSRINIQSSRRLNNHSTSAPVE
ncbi:MAG: hypothetical protein LC731_06660 [Acidobacteria bacterium]|nr:hypothetical protein [Acidobacteriota bacterium]